MMTKNRTQFVFIIAAGLSLISGFSQTANIGKNDDSSEDKTTKVENLRTATAIDVAMTIAVVAPIAIAVVMPISTVVFDKVVWYLIAPGTTTAIAQAAAVATPIIAQAVVNRVVLGIPMSLWVASLAVMAEGCGCRPFENAWEKEGAREQYWSTQKRRRERDRKRKQEFESNEDKTTKVENLRTYFEIIPKLVEDPYTYSEAISKVLPVCLTSCTLTALGVVIPQFEPVARIATHITVAGLLFVGADAAIEENFGNARFRQHKRAFNECLMEHTSGGGFAKVPLACREALRKLKCVATVTQVSEITGHFKENTTDN